MKEYKNPVARIVCLGNYMEEELKKYISDKRLIKKLVKYSVGSTITNVERKAVIRAVKRTKIGDDISFEAIIKRSKNLPPKLKKIVWLEPEEIKKGGEGDENGRD